MKDMKISAKLLLGFILVAMIAGFVGVYGTIMINQTDAGYSTLLENSSEYLELLGNLRESYQIERVALRDVVLDGLTDLPLDGALENLDQATAEVNKKFDEFEALIDSVDINQMKPFFVARDTHEGAFASGRRNVINLLRAGDAGTAAEILDSLGVLAGQIADGIADTVEVVDTIVQDDSAAMSDFSQTTVLFQIIVVILAVVIAVALGLYISSLIGPPTRGLCEVLELLGSTGTLTLPPEVSALAQKTAQRKDELGRSAAVFGALLARLGYISEQLEKIASGDLTGDIQLASEQDVMGISLKKMAEGLSQMFGEIQLSTEQVSTGSKQIADGAQSLAQGSTEQAAAVEQLSTSIGEVAAKTRENADMAAKAVELSASIQDSAQQGTLQMDQMIQAVKEINEASHSISKVIKAIDDIAFQTNILSLNAAVEAARAGQHGRGFAVVAEEVRNLAAKSAASAKDTGALIENSIGKAELGARIAGETADSLSKIVSGIHESTEIIHEIAESSEQQSHAITQINTGIDQVAQVVQQNSATAEESASASEQMDGQARMLANLAAQFKIVEGARRLDWAEREEPAQRVKMPPVLQGRSEYEAEGYGKY